MQTTILALSSLFLVGNVASAGDLGFKSVTPYDRFYEAGKVRPLQYRR